MYARIIFPEGSWHAILIPVTSGCNRWSVPIAVYQILSYKCMHGMINWTLISSETNLEEQLHLFPWWQDYTRGLFSIIQRSWEPRGRSTGMINTHYTHTGVKRRCKPCKNVLLIWWIVAGIIHGDYRTYPISYLTSRYTYILYCTNALTQVHYTDLI